MKKSEFETIAELAETYNTIPVCREIYADVITPISLLRRLAAVSKRFYLLESVEGGEKWGRYSFLGFDPVLRAVCRDGTVRLEGLYNETIPTENPMQVLRNILQEYHSPEMNDLPPFTGGFVGYFAYAMIGYAEPTLKIKKGDFDDYDMMLFDKVIAYDHLKQKICIIVNLRTGRNLKDAYDAAVKEIGAIIELIRDESPLPKTETAPEVHFTCNVTEKEYCDIVERTKEYIRNGDIFQAVISRQFASPYEGGLINAYRVLRTTNPSPYMVYFNIDGEEIISTSPETLVRRHNGRLCTFPVAGSRPRGSTEAEDLALEQELLRDEKELSEHNMLVDLGRNDLGRISKIGSVKVTAYKMIHRYSRIMHICSQVEGEIRSDCDACDAISAVLPAGTLSGAPKIRACEIIDALESEPRGIYGGALGYLDFRGNLDTCIAIRMAVKKNGRVFVRAGGGIVLDSVPEKEYQESANKALAVMNAIRDAKEVAEA